MNIKSLTVLFLSGFLTVSSAYSQIVLEQNRSLAQIQSEDGSQLFDSENVSKVRKQVEVNAQVVGMGILCKFPDKETETLHNAFLTQFSKYNFTKEDALTIAQIHKDKVSQTILLMRDKISQNDCNKFEPEFKKIYDHMTTNK